ncbi:MAG: hypothetical protein QM541_04770 [Flavobacterium sp.]|nr:hypothetical protein [Flavobacterium sp.]
MIQQILNNPFLNIRVGAGKFSKFANAHLESLKANNNNGQYNDIIAKLTQRVTPYTKWLSTQDQTVIERGIDTKDVHEVLDDFEDFTKSLFKEVNSSFEDSPSIIQEAFPHGKTEYNNITLIDAPVLLQRIANFCSKHKTNLRAGRDTTSKQLLNDFTSELQEQQSTKGTVKTGSDTGTELREAIATYLYEGLITLLQIHIGNREVVETLYDFSIVTPTRRAKENTPA